MFLRLQMILLLALSQVNSLLGSEAPSKSDVTLCKSRYSNGKKMSLKARLIRRQDGTSASKFTYTPPGKEGHRLGAGMHACSPVYSYNDNTQGVCLWSGNGGDLMLGPTERPGWWYDVGFRGTEAEKKKGILQGNCNKQITLEGKTGRLIAPVVDFCNVENQPISLEEGCFTIYVTAATFKALGGTSGDTVTINSWHFNETPK